MHWKRVEPAASLVRAAGFSDVTLGDLADVYDMAEHHASTEPWYVVTGRRGEQP